MRRPKQKFYESDLVYITQDLGISRAHFPSNCLAVIIDSTYEDGEYEYSLLLKDGDEISWYEEDDLTLKCSSWREGYHKWLQNGDEDHD